MPKNQDFSRAENVFRRRGLRIDLFLVVCWAASVATVAALLWIVVSILGQAWPAIQKTGLDFFVQSVWDPNRGKFGAFPFLFGTAVSSVVALLIALPLGITIAIFLSENFLPPAARQFIRFVVEMLAAI